jgi:transposase
LDLYTVSDKDILIAQQTQQITQLIAMNEQLMSAMTALVEQQKNLEKLVEQLNEQKSSLITKNADLTFQLDQLKRMIYGTKSERFIPASMPGQLSLLEIETDNMAVPAKLNVPTHERTVNGQKKPFRNILPDHLRRIEQIIYPEGYDESNSADIIGQEVTEILNYIPGEIYVERIVRPKYKTEQGKIVIGNLPERPIAKGLFGIALIVRILVDKYVDHLPLNRQLARFKRAGIVLAESTVGDVPRQVARLMELLYEELCKQVLASDYINVDETPTPVLDKNKKGKTHRGYHWVYYAPPKRLVLFDYRPGRGSEGPLEMLRNFKGFLQTDGYGVYDKYKHYEHITLMGCMAHARRYFEKALDSDKERAGYIMALIQKLYQIEKDIRNAEPTLNHEQILIIRKEKAAPLLKQIKLWLDEHLNIITPTSPLGKAITYAVGQWERLTVYLDHAHLRIDNNLVENAIRPTVLGRRNSLFSGSHDGAKRSAMIYSFFGSCKANNVNPEEWLADVLVKLPQTKKSEIYKLLPNYWKPMKAI